MQLATFKEKSHRLLWLLKSVCHSLSKKMVKRFLFITYL